MLAAYHGVFAARAKDHSEVVPCPVPVEPEPAALQLALGPELLPDDIESNPLRGNFGRGCCSGCSLLTS